MPNKSSFAKHADYLAYWRDYRRKNAERLRPYFRDYNKKWRKENGYEANRAYEKRWPTKLKARQLLSRAVQLGIIVKMPCSVCNSKVSQAHHPDYTKPLEVIWLCHVHHGEAHRK